MGRIRTPGRPKRRQIRFALFTARHIFDICCDIIIQNISYRQVISSSRIGALLVSIIFVFSLAGMAHSVEMEDLFPEEISNKPEKPL